MFGIGMQELAIILAVALIFVGPKKLPELARQLAKGVRELRRASDDLKSSIMVDLDEPATFRPEPSRQLPPRMDAPPKITGSQVATGDPAPFVTTPEQNAVSRDEVPTEPAPGSDEALMAQADEEAADTARLEEMMNDPAIKDAVAKASGGMNHDAPTDDGSEA